MSARITNPNLATKLWAICQTVDGSRFRIWDRWFDEENYLVFLVTDGNNLHRFYAEELNLNLSKRRNAIHG